MRGGLGGSMCEGGPWGQHQLQKEAFVPLSEAESTQQGAACCEGLQTAAPLGAPLYSEVQRPSHCPRWFVEGAPQGPLTAASGRGPLGFCSLLTRRGGAPRGPHSCSRRAPQLTARRAVARSHSKVRGLTGKPCEAGDTASESVVLKSVSVCLCLFVCAPMYVCMCA